MHEFFIKTIPFKNIRRKYRVQNIIKEHNEVATFLKEKYIIPFLEGHLTQYEITPKRTLQTEKIIWQYWGQGINDKTPPIVNLCFNSIKRQKGEYQQIILSNNSIQEYLNIPKFIAQKLKNNPEFTLTFFSDLLRIYLLNVYGGIWIDATIFLSDSIHNNLLQKDFFLFQRANQPTDYKKWEKLNYHYFSWQKNFKVNMLNSFIIAQKNNPIITSLTTILTAYWEKETSFKHYFLFQILFNELIQFEPYCNLNCEKISDTIPHLLLKNYNEQYDENILQDIYQKTSIHKLTYIKKYKTKSIYAHLLQTNIQ